MSEVSSEDEPNDELDRLVETENFGVTDEGNHLKVYKKTRDEFKDKTYFVKVAEVFKEVYDE